MIRKAKNNQLTLPAYFCHTCIISLRYRRYDKKQTIRTLIFLITAHGLVRRCCVGENNKSWIFRGAYQTKPRPGRFLACNVASTIPRLSSVSQNLAIVACDPNYSSPPPAHHGVYKPYQGSDLIKNKTLKNARRARLLFKQNSCSAISFFERTLIHYIKSCKVGFSVGSELALF